MPHESSSSNQTCIASLLMSSWVMTKKPSRSTKDCDLRSVRASYSAHTDFSRVTGHSRKLTCYHWLSVSRAASRLALSPSRRGVMHLRLRSSCCASESVHPLRATQGNPAAETFRQSKNPLTSVRSRQSTARHSQPMLLSLLIEKTIPLAIEPFPGRNPTANFAANSWPDSPRFQVWMIGDILELISQRIVPGRPFLRRFCHCGV